jgi:hypothetical protein
MVKRISVVLHEDVYKQIEIISIKENRSLNFTVTSLIQKALKEKNRKRGKKQNNTEHNS